MGADLQQFLFLVLVLYPSIAPTHGVSLDVFPQYDVDCKTPISANTSGSAPQLEEALNSLNTSDTRLVLQSGCHTIKTDVLIQDLADIAIAGVDANNVVIQCSDSSGLAFVNISHLQLENVEIRRCGFGNISLWRALNVANNSMRIFHQLPQIANISVGVFVADCDRLLVSTVHITNTPGIGFLGINIIGQSSFESAKFTNNTAEVCFPPGRTHALEGDVSGGAYLLYTNYRNLTTIHPVLLTISNSVFEDNNDCSPLVMVPTLRPTSQSAFQLGYALGSSGGLGIELAQTTFVVQVDVLSTTFKWNRGYYGGAVHVGLFQGNNGSQVTFQGCIFDSNGFGTERTALGLTTSGGAMSIFMNLLAKPEIQSLSLSDLDQLLPNLIIITNCHFTGNQATFSGAIQLLGLHNPFASKFSQNNVTLHNCLFQKNSAVVGTVIGAHEDKISGSYPGIQLILDGVEMSENFASTGEFAQRYIGSMPSTVSLISMNLTVTGVSQFIQNQGIAISATTSTINIGKGVVTFQENSGIVGGAIQLTDQSYLVLMNHSTTQFIHNLAQTSGGAIYVDLRDDSVESIRTDRCFLWFEYIDLLCNYTICPLPNSLNISMVFVNNTAPLGGTIYGSILDSCPWTYPLAKSLRIELGSNHGISLLEHLDHFEFTPQLAGAEVISTDPDSLVLPDLFGPVDVKPGQEVDMNITAYDRLNQSVPLVIRSSVKTSSTTTSSFAQNQTFSRLGLSGYWFIQGTNTSHLSVTFTGLENSTATISFADTRDFVETEFDIILEKCGFGFKFQSSNNSCVCDPELEQFQVTCSNVKATLLVPAGHWLGKSPVGRYAFHECIRDYCKPGEVMLTSDNFSVQCAPGYRRTGLLCGKCQPGTSAMFGTAACGDCPNSSIALIVVFAFAGIGLICFISFLGFTISHGYLNAVIFYSNVLNLFIPYISPSTANTLLVPIAFINLNLGIDTCFYDGMTALAKVGLQLAFPAYLFLLMIILIILARRSQMISIASAPKMLATLLLLCYSSVGDTCIEILGSVSFQGKNGYYLGWVVDPSVQYANIPHVFLVFLSLALLLFYILPFSVILLIPPYFIYRMKLGIRFMPMFDAFWSPFKPSFRFWLAFRCLLRIAAYSIAVYANNPYNLFLVALLLLLLLFIHGLAQPFQRRLQNSFESFFLINLLLLVVGSLYFARESPKLSDAYVYVVVGLAYMVMTAIAFIHISIRFPKLKHMFLACLCCCCRRYRRRKHQKVTEDGDVTDHTAILAGLDHDKPRATYSELRESMLESRSIRLHPILPDS